MNKQPLFAVDVDAEIRKLCERQFKSEGEPATELIRFAVKQGASRIHLTLHRKRLIIRCQHASLDERVASLMAVIFDPTCSPDLRHDALVTLEHEHGLGILAAFAGRPSRVIVEWLAAENRRGMEFRPEGPPIRFKTKGKSSLKITIVGRRGHLAKEKAFIEKHCRYLPVPIQIGAKTLEGRFGVHDCLVHVELRNARMTGTIGLPLKENLSRIARLEHYVLKEEKVRPMRRGLIYTAVVEEKNDDFPATKATLKRAARRLYLMLAKTHNGFDAKGKARATDLLFERYQNTLESELLRGVRTFQQVGGPPLDYFEIREAARGKKLYAIDLESSPKSFETTGRTVLRIGPRKRQFLEQDPLIELATPPPKIRNARLKLNWSTHVRQLIRRAQNRFGKGPGNPLPDERLSAEEFAFLNAIRTEFTSGNVTLEDEKKPSEIIVIMAEKQKHPWIRAAAEPGEYYIARSHPDVQTAIRAVSKNPSYLYPALAMLTQGHNGYASIQEHIQKTILRHHAAVHPDA